jgi:hypothetical protein
VDVVLAGGRFDRVVQHVEQDIELLMKQSWTMASSDGD